MSSRKKQNCNTPLRAAIIGCGCVAGGYDHASSERGIRTHSKAYALNEYTELVAACDVDRERLQDFIRAWEVEEGYTDAREMLQYVSPDIVSICAPDDSHYDLLEMCLDFPSVRGVWCEKPLAKDTKGCAELITRYRESGVRLLVNYMRSFCADYLKLKEQLLAGEFGKIQKVSVYYTKGIMHNGSHAVDLLLDWLGKPKLINVTHAFVDYDPEDPTVDAYVLFDDVPVNFIGLNESCFSIFTIEIFTNDARVSLEEFGRRLIIRRIDSGPQSSGHRILDYPHESDTKLAFAMADSLSCLVNTMGGHNSEINESKALNVLDLTASLAEMGRKLLNPRIVTETMNNSEPV